ncbi:unnamed protein product [Clonostachys rosea]|uniref:Clr5 domain-containing protein n=1 Tax=Bionectria ochroleuca TaxID=29856 RepID=A0ABY6ULQ3_BIOOC|nr:unnamed protein product [Clonostachys rosea]
MDQSQNSTVPVHGSDDATMIDALPTPTPNRVPFYRFIPLSEADNAFISGSQHMNATDSAAIGFEVCLSAAHVDGSRQLEQANHSHSEFFPPLFGDFCGSRHPDLSENIDELGQGHFTSHGCPEVTGSSPEIIDPSGGLDFASFPLAMGCPGLNATQTTDGSDIFPGTYVLRSTHETLNSFSRFTGFDHDLALGNFVGGFDDTNRPQYPSSGTQRSQVDLSLPPVTDDLVGLSSLNHEQVTGRLIGHPHCGSALPTATIGSTSNDFTWTDQGRQDACHFPNASTQALGCMSQEFLIDPTQHAATPFNRLSSVTCGSHVQVPETQSGTGFMQQFDGVTAQNNAIDHCNPTLVNFDVYRNNTDPGSQIVQRRNRHTDTEWKEVEDALYRLYITERQTAEEVQFAMSAIHGFEACLSTFQKRLRELKKESRTRAAKAYYKISLATRERSLFEIVSDKKRRILIQEKAKEVNILREGTERRRQLQVERGNKQGSKKRHSKPKAIPDSIGPLLNTVYIHQERLFHYIDIFWKGLFDSGDKGWTVDAFNFKPSTNTSNGFEDCQMVSDKISSILLLAQNQLYHHANFMLENVLIGLRNALRLCNPNFMLHFWMMCQALSSGPWCSKEKGSQWLRWFLRNVKAILSPRFPNHPITMIADSLLEVWSSSPREFKPTLGLGHWKSTATLGGLIGHTHRIVLNMGVGCKNIWPSKFSASENVADILRQPILPNSGIVLEAECKAELSLNYLSAVSKGKFNEMRTIEEATQLLEWSGEICRNKARRSMLEFDSVTRLFVFSTDLVATHHLETWKQPEQKQNNLPNRHSAYKYMDEAIEILRQGDIQCSIRAAVFSKRLFVWIKGHPEKATGRTRESAREIQRNQERKEKARTANIIRQIPKQRISGARRVRWVQGQRKDASRDRRVAERNLLQASLSI